MYHNMVEANKAQVVMLKENDLISVDLAEQLANALIQVVNDKATSASKQDLDPDYLKLEARLVELIGHQASNIHLGRSRNDLGATMNRMLMRDRLLDLLDRIATVRAILQRMAGDHVDTVMPGFTHAVQAQPSTLAHFLLAFDASLNRDGQRIREAYARINRSPLGSAAFNTSGFALDRERLAELLGFDGLVENSYDAIMVSVVDSKVEFASALSISALNVGRFAQYLLFQYDDSAPGLLLTGSITGRSSIMPQKRNPSAIERLRLTASAVVGQAQTSTLLAHNTPMYEVKDAREDHLIRLDQLADTAALMYEKVEQVLLSLTVRKDRLRELVDNDYSTMTELADTLHREADVPFRTGYKVASELTTYGRSLGKAPGELTRDEVATVYRKVTGDAFPLSVKQMNRTFDAAEFIRSRKGRGGPQPESMSRMLTRHQQDLADIRRWVENEENRLEKAAENLNADFSSIVE